MFVCEERCCRCHLFSNETTASHLVGATWLNFSAVISASSTHQLPDCFQSLPKRSHLTLRSKDRIDPIQKTHRYHGTTPSFPNSTIAFCYYCPTHPTSRSSSNTSSLRSPSYPPTHRCNNLPDRWSSPCHIQSVQS